MERRVTGLVALFCAVAVDAGAQTLFRADFNTGSSPYNFEQQYAFNGYWQYQHLAGGGWTGGGAHVIHNANLRQYNLGWELYTGNYTTPHTWAVGDLVYIRLRLRYDDDWRWDGQSAMSNKMIDLGIGGHDQSRVIMRVLKPGEFATTCQPAMSLGSNYGGITVGQGITDRCTPPVTITHSRWHHVQFAVQTSASGNGYMKVWVDNNTFANPSSQITGLTQFVDEWNGSWNVGGFMTDYPIRTSGFIIDDFEVGLSFDPNWAQGAGGATPPASTNTGLPWQSNFETNDFSEWNGGTYNTTGLAISTSGCQSGRCARAPLVTGNINDNYAEHRFGDYYRIGGDKVEEVYLRFYSKIDTGYVSPSDGQKMAIFNLTNGVDGDRRYQVYVKVLPNGTYGVDHSDIADWRFYTLTQNQGTAVAPRLGQWDKIKMYVRLNTPGQSDGIVRLWVNDTLKLQYTNLNIRETTNYGMSKVLLTSWTSESGRGNSAQWWDTWTLSQTDPDGGSPPPTSPPSAPTNLRIVSE